MPIIYLISSSIFVLFHLLIMSSNGQDDDLFSDHLALAIALKQQQLKNTYRRHVSKWKPCKEISDKNTTFLKAVGRFSNKIVEVNPAFAYDVSFCNSERTDECAKDSLCSTIYRWQPARTRPINEEIEDYDSGKNEFSQDEILVPSGCMCVIGSKKKNNIRHPIILED